MAIGLHQGSVLSPYLFALIMDEFNYLYLRGALVYYVCSRVSVGG